MVIAGGTESLSDVPILHSRRFAALLVEASKAKSLGARLGVLARTRPRDLVPVTPAIAEPSTGLTMGQSAEKMAKENGISREAQDRFALRSHQPGGRRRGGRPAGRGDRARSSCRRRFEPVGRGQRRALRQHAASSWPRSGRRSTAATAPSRRPTRRRSPTAPAAVLLMSDEAARAHGHAPLAYIRSYAVAAVDPGGQLLMGPAFAVPKALERAGITWKDLGVVEMHEAFAAQVLSNVQAFESRRWAEEHLGRSEPVGEVDWDITNVMGGSHRDRPPLRRDRRAARRRRWRTRCGGAARSSGSSRSARRAAWASRWSWRRGDERRRVRRDAASDGVAVVTFDLPGEPVNKFTRAVRDEFAAVLGRAGAGRRGAGGRLHLRASGTPSSPARTSTSSSRCRTPPRRRGSRGRGSSSSTASPRSRSRSWWRSTGAASVAGSSSSLACHYRVATDHPKTVLALPEVQLGIIPGAGGCNRLPRLVGLRAALEMILSSRNVRAAKAFRMGLVDELVPPAILRDVAVAAARRLAGGERPAGAAAAGLAAWFFDRTAAGRALVLRQARAMTLQADPRALPGAARRPRGGPRRPGRRTRTRPAVRGGAVRPAGRDRRVAAARGGLLRDDGAEEGPRRRCSRLRRRGPWRSSPWWAPGSWAPASPAWRRSRPACRSGCGTPTWLGSGRG